MMTSTEFPAYQGLAILIKAPGVKRTFVPRKGETITITDKNGKELWSIKVPIPNSNPGVIINDVQIDLLTERDFARFCQNTWTSRPMPALRLPEQPPSPGLPADSSAEASAKVEAESAEAGGEGPG